MESTFFWHMIQLLECQTLRFRCSPENFEVLHHPNRMTRVKNSSYSYSPFEFTWLHTQFYTKRWFFEKSARNIHWENLSSNYYGIILKFLRITCTNKVTCNIHINSYGIKPWFFWKNTQFFLLLCFRSKI